MTHCVLGILSLSLLIKTSTAVTGEIGGSISIQCDLNQPTSVSWQKRTRALFSDLTYDTSKYEGRYTEILTIKQLSFPDEAYYRCQTYNNLGYPVYGSQILLLVFKSYRKITGQEITFDATRTSSSYSWQKYDDVYADYIDLTSSNRIYGTNSKKLTIKNIKLTDTGKYRCKLFDGSVTRPVILKVETVNINGGWGSWSNWAYCSVTCGTGTSYRTRQCNNPSPSGSGLNCIGNSVITSSCLVKDCPVDGMWSVWSVWGPCSVSCGVGTKSRTRRCDNPPPAHKGQNCVGSETDESICEDAFCPVDGGWSDWSMWTTCAVSCGVGNKTRDRTCTNPEPLHNGRKCNENSLELDSCSIKACPEVTDQQSALGPAVGGVSGAILVLLMVVLLAVVILKKRKRNVTQRKNGSTNTRHLDQAEQNVLFRPEPNGKDRMYFNIESNGTHSCSDTDTDDHNGSNDIIAKSKEETNSEIVYCNFNENMSESMNIKIEELGNYIKIRKIKNELEKEYKTLKYGAQYPTTFATTKENMPKNRFKTIFPYDHTRVILQNGPNYINANYINGFEKENCYVASQGPIKSTVTDHWRMIWQLNICKIVMLTNLVEDGKRKCEKYWPDGDKHSTYGNFILTLLSEKCRAAYVTREISMMNKTTKENRTVIQYHFTSWPDHGTPDPLYLVLFYRHASIQSALDTRPVLVHCSAGIGRTGTYIGLDALYEQGKTTGYIDVAAYVGKMRYCRMNMIQTQEQYVCLHDSLNEAFTMENTNIAKNDFGNVWREILLDKRPTNHQRLKKEFKMLEEKKKEHTKTEHAVANSPNNKDKNRNKNVLPSDTNRVYLSSFEKGRTDYINAVHAPSYTQFVGYVTTQLPLPDTKVDFWTLIRDQDSSIIVLLLKDHKEADFVYSNAKSTGSLGFNTLKLTNSVEDDGMKTLSFTLSKKDDRQRNIVIYQVASDSLPEASVLCKLANVMSTRISMTESPVTVVSSDGASRCGLFCTFINAVSSMTIDENADIFQLARLLQLRRPEFFKDYEEYKKVYEAVNNYLESSNVYANY